MLADKIMFRTFHCPAARWEFGGAAMRVSSSATASVVAFAMALGCLAAASRDFLSLSLSHDVPTPSLSLVSRTEGLLPDGTRLIVLGVQNVSAGLLEVVRVQPSCSCFNISMEPLRIEPGGRGQIRAIGTGQSNPSGNVSVIYLREGSLPESVEFSLVGSAGGSASSLVPKTSD